MAHPVLHEDWSYYDDKKKRGGSDHRQFSCTESWEVDYLVEKLKKHYPYKTENAIRAAIAECCKQHGSRQREDFVGCVTRRLDS